MRQLARPTVSTPDMARFPDDSGGVFRRVLVPVASFSSSINALSVAALTGLSAGGALRLVHVRIWDPPVPGAGGRSCPETSEEATTVLDEAMRYVWARGAEARGIVIEAQRSRLAPAIITEAQCWAADAIVLTAPPRHLLALGPWDKATRLIVREAPCPVLVVYPRRP